MNNAPSQAEGIFRLAVEACPNGMVMIDRAGTMLMVNAEIERAFGYRREELIGQCIEILVAERLRAQHALRRAAFHRQHNGRHIGNSLDLAGLRRDGSEFPVEIGLTSVSAGDGHLVLGVVVDVSEHRRAARLKDEFVSTVSHELRTPLTSIAASLGLLGGRRTGKLPDSAAQLLMIAHKNSQRLVRLVNDILDIEKIESGCVAFNLAQVDVRSLVEDAIASNHGFAESHGVHLRLAPESMNGDVNADPDRLAQVITNLLSNAIKFSPADSQVMVAVKNSGDLVRISVRDHGPGVPENFKPRIFEKFAQADAANNRRQGGTGLGLSIVREIVERLGGAVGFDEAPGGGTIFHVELPVWDSAASQDVGLEVERERPAARLLHADENSGLLAIVTHTIITMADVVQVDAVEGARGALASEKISLGALDVNLKTDTGKDLLPGLRIGDDIEIPIIIVRAQGAGTTADRRVQAAPVKSRATIEDLAATVHDRLQHPPASILIGGRPMAVRILHVEDEPDIREVVELSLGLDPNFVTRSCDSGQKALVAAVDWTPDLILLDVMMPVMDGPTTLARLRENAQTASIPVVFMTACAQARQLDQFRSLGIAGVIPKPFDPMILAASVRAFIKPESDQLTGARNIFRRRFRDDVATLTDYRTAFKDGTTSPATLDRIKEIAHGLAGAGGIFGYSEISEAANELAEAVAVELHGEGLKYEIERALDRLLACADVDCFCQPAPAHSRIDA